MTNGYLSWSYGYLQIPPIIAGYPLSQLSCPMEFGTAYAPSGIAIDMLSGSAVYQRVPVTTNAPLDIRPIVFSLKFQMVVEEDYFRLKRAHQFSDADPVPCFFGYPIEDMWKLPHTGTEFGLTRSTPYGLVSSTDWLYDGYLTDINDGSQSAVAVTLDTGANEIAITASPGASGYFVFRYFPIHLCRMTKLSDELDKEGDLVITAEFTEIIPNRVYV